MTRENPLLPILVTALAILSFPMVDALMKGASIVIGCWVMAPGGGDRPKIQPAGQPVNLG